MCGISFSFLPRSAHCTAESTLKLSAGFVTNGDSNAITGGGDDICLLMDRTHWGLLPTQ